MRSCSALGVGARAGSTCLPVQEEAAQSVAFFAVRDVGQVVFPVANSLEDEGKSAGNTPAVDTLSLSHDIIILSQQFVWNNADISYFFHVLSDLLFTYLASRRYVNQQNPKSRTPALRKDYIR